MVRFASDLTFNNDFLSSLFKAHFSFKRTLPTANRTPDFTNDSPRLHTSASQDVASLNRHHVPSQEARDNLRFGTQPGLSSNQKFDDLRREPTAGKSFGGYPDRYATHHQSPSQFQSNLDDPKDILGFLCWCSWSIPFGFYSLFCTVPDDLSASRTSRSRHRDSVDTSGRSMSPIASMNDEKSRLSSGSPLPVGDAPNVVDADISAIMKGANDLKNTRTQLEEQVLRICPIPSLHL